MKEYLIKEQYEDHKNDLEGQRYKIMEEIFMATVMEQLKADEEGAEKGVSGLLSPFKRLNWAWTRSKLW